MDRGSFELQNSAFINDDPTIMDRAVEVANLYHTDRRAFINKVADTPTPEHLWNIAQIALLERDSSLAVALSLTAQLSMESTLEKMHVTQDDAAMEHWRETAENYSHVIDSLETLING